MSLFPVNGADGEADWTSIVFHSIIGLVMGAVTGLLVIYWKNGLWLNEKLILPFLCGTALTGAGLASRLGVALQFGKNTESDDAVTEPPSHSRFSKRLCGLFILTGIALSAATLLQQYRG